MEGVVSAQPAKNYRFLFSPKSTDNPFFDIAKEGCMDKATSLGIVECVYVGPLHFQSDGEEQALLIDNMLSEIDGVAISVTNGQSIAPVISKAVSMGLPVVTWDSDAPHTERASYIGTDQYFFGTQLAKVLKQLHPEGGTYVLISEPNTPNIAEREKGVRDNLSSKKNQRRSSNSVWVELDESPTDIQGNTTLAIQQMYDIAARYPNLTAIIPVMGGPMFLEDQWKIFVRRNRHLQLVVADALPLQLGLLSRNYAGGLVEQLPYEMGELSMTALLELVEGRPYPKFKGTNVLEHINVPLVLPHLTVNQNHLGGLKYVGFVFTGIIAIVATFCICWTFQKRNVRVVKVSQPFFLIMVASGVLIMGLSIIPLSFDDSVFNHTDERGVVVCMSPLWLLFCGFTVTFSAFFAKTWRINKLFHSQTPYQRATVNAKDVLYPFFILMALNIICLSLWTSIDPLKLARHEHDGTDGWNRIISTYSICECNNSLPYVLPLAFINFGVLVLANYEAFKARMIESEFSESKHIAIAMVSITQASLSGIPLLFLVREQPQAFYLVVVLLFSITCMVILLVIFIPKMKMSKRFLERSADSQRNVIRESIMVSRKAAEASSQHRSSMSRKQSSMGPPDGKPQTPHSRAEDSTYQESSFNQSISVPKSTKRGSFGSSQFSSGSMISRQFDQLDDTSASFNMDKSIGSAFVITTKRLSDLRENDSEYEDSKASGCLDTSVGSAKLADTKQEEQPVTSSSN